VLASAVATAGSLIVWPAPVFAYAAGTGKVMVGSDEPIPAAGANASCGIAALRQPTWVHESFPDYVAID
jgi:hypothetical protein